MSTLVLDRPGCRHEAAQPAPAMGDGVGGEPTLDQVLSGAWEGLAAHQRVACPVCGGNMTPSYGAHARPVGGRCQSCETQLS